MIDTVDFLLVLQPIDWLEYLPKITSLGGIYMLARLLFMLLCYLLVHL